MQVSLLSFLPHSSYLSPGVTAAKKRAVRCHPCHTSPSDQNVSCRFRPERDDTSVQRPTTIANFALKSSPARPFFLRQQLLSSVKRGGRTERYMKFHHPAAQRTWIHAQHLSGTARTMDFSFASYQRILYMAYHNFIQRQKSTTSDILSKTCRFFRRKTRHKWRLRIRKPQNKGLLQCVSQLSDVTRLGKLLQTFKKSVFQRRLQRSRTPDELRDEIFRKHGYVLRSTTERWNGDGKNIESIKKILTEAALS